MQLHSCCCYCLHCTALEEPQPARSSRRRSARAATNQTHLQIQMASTFGCRRRDSRCNVSVEVVCVRAASASCRRRLFAFKCAWLLLLLLRIFSALPSAGKRRGTTRTRRSSSLCTCTCTHAAAVLLFYCILNCAVRFNALHSNLLTPRALRRLHIITQGWLNRRECGAQAKCNLNCTAPQRCSERARKRRRRKHASSSSSRCRVFRLHGGCGAG